MSHKTVYSVLSDVDISATKKLPVAHIAWREGSAPSSLPWAVYLLDSESGVAADDTVHASRRKWIVELYQKARDNDLEAALEKAILDNFSPYEKSESWIETENCLMTSYNFTEIEKVIEND